jgi:2-succinyl-5-enolpyruvyl-6-hydroxy-3-cyclohexene-1-carboxylate synthase
VTDREVADVGYWCAALAHAVSTESVEELAPPDSLVLFDERVEGALVDAIDGTDALSEPFVSRWLSLNVDPEHALFVSNSLPIRDLQAYAGRTGPRVPLAANRGASGIDGVVSSAAGYAEGRDTPVTLLVGDVALLHDLNALAHVGQCEQPLTIVLLNNGGGGIFSLLPVAKHEDVLTPLVSTPHALQFEGACATFDLAYARVTERVAFETAYRDAVRSGGPALIEVASTLEGNRAEHERIEAAVEAVLG